MHSDARDSQCGLYVAQDKSPLEVVLNLM